MSAIRSVLVVAAISMAQPVLADTYGAIAYNSDTRQATAVTKQPSKDAALKAARATCKGSKCETPLWFKSACGALASSSGGSFGTGWGNTPAIASQKATKVCNSYGGGNCKVRLNVCTPK